MAIDQTTVTENILTAIETVAKSVVNGVQFNKTLTCTIVDASFAEEGRYIVTDGSTKFSAYTDNKTYKVGNIVYVTILNSDMGEQKIILGRKTGDNEQPFNYVSPLDNFIPCTENFIHINSPIGIRVNSASEGAISNYNLGSINNVYQKYRNFDKLGIRAKFQTNLPYKQLASGDYGIRLDITYENQSTQQIKKDISTDTGYREDREYYVKVKGTNTYAPVYIEDKIDVDYKNNEIENITDGYYYVPGKYYYKNYILDTSFTPSTETAYFVRIQDNKKKGEKYKSIILAEDSDVLYEDKEGNKIIHNITEEDYGKKFWRKKEDNFFEEIYIYAPETFYYVPEDKEFILSEDNGFNKDLDYYVQLDAKYTPVEILLDKEGNPLKFVETFEIDDNIEKDTDLEMEDISEQQSEVIYRSWGERTFYYQNDEGYYEILKEYDPNKKIYEMEEGLGTSIILTSETYVPGKYLVETKTSQVITSSLFLNVSDMIGQPYNFVAPFQQEKLFDISSFGKIIKISASLYQANDFKDISGKALETNKNDKNIIFSDMELFLGYELPEEEDNFIQLFTTDTLTYRQKVRRNSDNAKTIELKWARKIDDELYVIDNNNLDIFNEEYKKNLNKKIEETEEGKLEDEDLFKRIKLDLSSNITEDRKYFKLEKRLNKDSIPKEVFYTPTTIFRLNGSEPYNENRDYWKIEYKEVANGDFKRVLDKVQTIKSNGDKELLPFDSKAKYFVPVGDSASYKEIVFENEQDYKNFTNLDQLQKQYFVNVEDNSGTYVKEYVQTTIDPSAVNDLFDYYYLELLPSNSNETATTSDIYDLVLVDVDSNTYEREKYYYFDTDVDNLEIRWYRYKLGAKAADEYCGVNWVQIAAAGNETEETKQCEDNPFKCVLYPDAVYDEIEKVKAIIIYDGQAYYSEELEFTNEDPVINIPTEIQEQALRIHFEDNSLGNYYLYDEQNRLINVGESQTTRQLKLRFDVDDYTTTTPLMFAESVTWIVPAEKTMIELEENNQGIKTVDSDNKSYVLVDTTGRYNYVLNYRIKNLYAFTDNNNTITCNVVKDGVFYSATAELSFGQAGSNGTEYTLVLDLQTPDHVVTIGANTTGNLYYKTFKKVSEDTQIQKGTIDYYKKINDVYQKIDLDKEKLPLEVYTYTGYEQVGNFDSTNIDTYYRKEEVEEGEPPLYIETNISSPKPINRVVATLYNQNHQVVNLSGTETFTWSLGNKNNSIFSISNNTTDSSVINLKTTISELKSNAFYHETISATLSGFGNYDLTATLAIPLRQDYAPVKYQGPVDIIYSSYGAPNYYTNEIGLFYNNDKGTLTEYPYSDNSIQLKFEENYQLYNVSKESFDKLKNKLYKNDYISVKDDSFNSDTIYYIKIEGKEDYQFYDISSEENFNKLKNKLYKNDYISVKDDSFNDNIAYYIKIGEETNDQKQAQNYFLPTLIDVKDNQTVIGKKLKASELYIENAPLCSIQFYHSGNLIWVQPLNIIQNRYFSSTINSWDGKLKVDDEENSILAKSMAAGIKNRDNTFSGVIMGDWSNSNADGAFDPSSGLGIYGFHEGQTSFGWSAMGTGFIGKSGRGRIYFDGDHGQIVSASWHAHNQKPGIEGVNPEGMYLDIDDGMIMLANGKGKYIKLNSLATSERIKNSRRDDLISNFYSPKAADQVKPGEGEDIDDPFVIYGNANNFTSIGWQGNLTMKGTRENNGHLIQVQSNDKYNENYTYYTEDGEKSSIKNETDFNNKKSNLYYTTPGIIGISASADYFPINVNRHFGVGWDGSLLISADDIKGEMLQNLYSSKAELSEGVDSATDWTKIVTYDDIWIDKDNESYYDCSHRFCSNNQNQEQYIIDANKLNNFDYTQLNPKFKGFYVTPYGDTYLSRKMVIGNNFAVNREGYLRAFDAMFSNCDSNTFTIRYTGRKGSRENENFEEIGWNPDKGGSLSTDIAKDLYPNTEYLRKYYKNDRYTPIMGEIGYVPGATSTDGSETTFNLGITTETNVGIKLQSNRSISIDARYQKDTNVSNYGNDHFFQTQEPLKSCGGIYINDRTFENMSKYKVAFNITKDETFFKDFFEKTDDNSWQEELKKDSEALTFKVQADQKIIGISNKFIFQRENHNWDFSNSSSTNDENSTNSQQDKDLKTEKIYIKKQRIGTILEENSDFTSKGIILDNQIKPNENQTITNFFTGEELSLKEKEQATPGRGITIRFGDKSKDNFIGSNITLGYNLKTITNSENSQKNIQSFPELMSKSGYIGFQAEHEIRLKADTTDIKMNDSNNKNIDIVAGRAIILDRTGQKIRVGSLDNNTSNVTETGILLTNSTSALKMSFKNGEPALDVSGISASNQTGIYARFA